MQCRAIWWCVSGYCGVVQAGVPLLCRALEMSSCRAGEAGGDRDEAAGKKSPRAMHQCVTSVADGSARGSSTRKICAVLANHLLQAGVCVCVCVRAPGKASVSLCIGTKRLPWTVQYALLLDGVYVESERETGVACLPSAMMIIAFLRYVTGHAAANHPRPCRCRVVCSRHRRC